MTRVDQCEHEHQFVVPYYKGREKVFIVCRFCKDVLTKQMAEVMLNEHAALKDALELAWGIIANASDWNIDEGDTPCGKKAKEWQNTAARWRDRYHALLTAEESE